MHSYVSDGKCQTERENFFWFLKRTRSGEECQGPLRQFDEGIARFLVSNQNCWACARHWIRAHREANEFCSSPLSEHSTELSSRIIPRRFHRLFDRVGANVPNYRPCNKCAVNADNVFSNEPDYIPSAKVSLIC